MRGREADLVLALHFAFALFAVLGGFLALVDWRVMLFMAWFSGASRIPDQGRGPNR
jgi:hypothetical protein